jgi:serine/threonine-protein kinase HipA
MPRSAEPRLDVYFREDLVGRLRLDERRRFVFQYERKWLDTQRAIPLSLSLPLRDQPFLDDAARPFFANLLPEAEIRKVIARRLRISEENDFALLKAIGGECAGAVSVFPVGTRPLGEEGYRDLSDEELNKIVAELPRKPLLTGEKGIRLSLAGAQNKLPVYAEGDRIFVPTGNAPTTHILKPPIPGFEETVENEAFCMMLAERIGLSVPKVSLRRGREMLYLVERFDRIRDVTGKVLRLHQEDFCQALGILPEEKYESEGGPSLSRCFALLKERSASPAADQRALILWVVFNQVIGNADAHAKNLAILYSPAGPRLAPFYDLLCTRVYSDLSDRLAMRIGGENRPAWIQPRHWERFSADVGIKPGLIRRIVEEMSEKMAPAADSLAKDFASAYGETMVVEKIVRSIKKFTSRQKIQSGK